MTSILAALALALIGYTVGSVKIINQANEALVERLGRYHRKLTSGLNFIVPFLDVIVLEDTTREQVLDIPPQEAITRDNVSLTVDAVVYWRIVKLERTYYEVEDIEMALSNLVTTTLRSQLGRMDLEQTYSSRTEVNEALLQPLSQATQDWGVQVSRVDVQNITLPKAVLDSMEKRRSAEIQAQAAILAAEGEQKAALKRAAATVESMKLIANALETKSTPQEVLKFLLAEKYVEANQKLSESTNSKVLFMDPKVLTESLGNLMESSTKASPDIDLNS
ncbi:MAG: stomatin-like protein [Leptolyngbyaceae bacterium]|nr:stomatin-like protein [Leptolyngbyaceae bacterium]